VPRIRPFKALGTPRPRRDRMKLMRMLAAASAALLLTASLAGACDGHKSEGAALTSGGGCKAKASATNASGGGCQKSGAMNASGGGCKKAGAMNASGTGCAKAKAGCCAKGEPVMATVGDTTDSASCKFRAGAVALKGTVLCNHCDLHKAETCSTMFKTENGCLFALSGEKAGSLREAAVGGNKLVRIKGELNDKGELVVSTFRVVRTLDSGASAM
jgi:hypothetical protein